jgi:hypothetical protein
LTLPPKLSILQEISIEVRTYPKIQEEFAYNAVLL